MSTDLLLLLALPLLFVPVSQDVHIRINSAKSPRDALTGVLLAGLCYFVFVGRYLQKDSGTLGILAFVALAIVIALEAYGYKAAFRAFLYAGAHLVAVLAVKKERAT